MPNTPKYPNATVSLTLTENAFEIMGAVSKALKKAGATKEEINQYTMDSMSGDYENLTAQVEKWVVNL